MSCVSEYLKKKLLGAGYLTNITSLPPIDNQDTWPQKVARALACELACSYSCVSHPDLNLVGFFKRRTCVRLSRQPCTMHACMLAAFLPAAASQARMEVEGITTMLAVFAGGVARAGRDM